MLPAKCDLTRDALDQLDARLANNDRSLRSFKTALTEGSARQIEAFESDAPIDRLVRARARLVDGILIRAWRQCGSPLIAPCALCAVGGFGRGQLHPGSDIDIMVVAPDAALLDQHQGDLAEFFTLLWDIGLEVGHSARTVEDCVREATDDVTVATALMESRLLDGDPALFKRMRAATGPDRIWPSAAFFEAKLAEQRARHERYNDTGYNLEPNIKGSPGGLRDIQMVGWVAKRHFGAETLHDLVDKGFLTEAEFDGLSNGRSFLWKLRYALHIMTGRREDRLLFDHQLSHDKISRFLRSSYLDSTSVWKSAKKFVRSLIKF
ncbi:MAG: nucleotidyltransferase domain-containing protein, partial [Pseudomonadota bacterium]